ncbi:hypothetical protein D3C78_1818530 [compost metagenome]
MNGFRCCLRLRLLYGSSAASLCWDKLILMQFLVLITRILCSEGSEVALQIITSLMIISTGTNEIRLIG